MFFYDGIDHLEITDLINKGIIEGVTTNLTIVNERKKFLNKSRNEILENFIDDICKFGVPLSIQVESNTCDEIIAVDDNDDKWSCSSCTYVNGNFIIIYIFNITC
jgi:hypothetical protein